MTRFHLKQERGKVLIGGVDNLHLEGLKKEALRSEEAAEEVLTCADLLLRGQGPDNEPYYHALRPDNLIGLSVPAVEGGHVQIRSGDGGAHVLGTL